jgi:hypothetical protein
MSDQEEYRIEGRDSTIFRVVHDKNNPYVIINKAAMENPALSFKAKGILAYLMSRPDGWEVSVADLVNRGIDGKASIRAGLQELEEAGHMRRYASRKQGRITGWHIEVYELPIAGPNDPHPIPPDTDNRNVVSPTYGGWENSPESDFLHLENQHLENRTQVLST